MKEAAAEEQKPAPAAAKKTRRPQRPPAPKRSRALEALRDEPVIPVAPKPAPMWLKRQEEDKRFDAKSSR